MALRDKVSLGNEPLFLMDGTAFVFRGFYAYQNMARSDGFPTNALFIVTRIVLKLLREENPAHFAFVMDGKGPNFRHDLFPAYKAQRGPAPEGLVAQLGPVRDMLTALGIPVIVSDGCEADDCIASLTARFKAERPIVIIGADKDLKQCLDTNVILWDPGGKEEKITTLADFRAGEGMEPSSWPDYQAIIGDSSDNIPGVPGVGPKTASELFRQFSTLEEIRDRFALVPLKIARKLEGNLDAAFLYRQLTTLSTRACSGLTAADVQVRPIAMQDALDVMARYELRSLMRELTSMERAGLVHAVPGQGRSAARANPAPVAAARKATARENASSNTPSTTLVVPPIPEDIAWGADQGTLFDLVPVSSPPAVAVTDSLTEMPAFEGAVVALVPLEGQGIAVAGPGMSFLYTGNEAALASRLEALAGFVVVPDLKALYRRNAVWRALPAGRCFDLSLAAYLLNPEERDYAWPHLVRRWIEQVPAAVSPTADPGAFALNLHETFVARLAAARQETLMRDLEMPLIPVLTDMEATGIRIDRAAFAAFLADVQRELNRLEKSICDHAGGPFNIRSAQQLGEVLFTRLNLPAGGKTRGGGMSTSQESLEKLSGKYPIVDEILEFRVLEKLRSTYLEPLPRLADGEDRIHTTFNLLATATGRLSSSNPNLQNIPVRGPFGQRMRACFVARPGCLLVSADYSQVELRILAHLARDPILTEAFRNGEDIHTRTASLLFDAEPDQVTTDQRRHAKTINFGLIYGMGPQKLSQDLGISIKEAKTFIGRYFERLGALRLFYDSVEREARAHGYVTTITGRRRYIPGISSENHQLRSQARRQAINARVQGSAADIIKIAMLAISSDQELASLNARLLLQVHDELVMEVPENAANQAGRRMAALMSQAAPGTELMTVPLAVDWGAGPDWNTAH